MAYVFSRCKIFFLVAAFFLLGVQVSVAQGEWQKNQYQYKDFSLPYQWFTPNDIQADKIPLVVVLHGSYEAGTDNEHHMLKGTNIGPDYFTRGRIQALQQSFVLAAQTPVDIRWASTDIADYDLETTPITISMEALLHLIDETIDSNTLVDASRVYIVGLSRGGQGVWNAAFQRPDLFAAYVPISGSASPKHGKQLVGLPIWTFHGDQDEITDVRYTRDMVDAIIRAGGSTKDLRYTEIEGGDHADSWLVAYHNEDIYTWMLKHRKSQ